MASSKATPMMQQYLAIKDQYPDTILFYRMGDFYEMFFEDAEVASKVLEIALTSRNKKDDNPIPMCGVPYRAAQNYVARLIDSGLKVAVCDQMEDPSKTKGLVKREVVRVITPGMIIENELLDAKTNNWVLCVARSAKATGLACLDLSTATFRLTESDALEALIEEVRRNNIDTPVLILSAKRSVDDRVKGLKTGSDDYLVKPFAFSELLARVQALIRRSTRVTAPSELKIADLTLDLNTRKVFRADREVFLQPLEFSLLEYLMRNAGRVVSKTMIMEHVWDYNFSPQTNVVEARICYLRDKIDKDFDAKLIHTVRGVGYVLKEDS